MHQRYVCVVLLLWVSSATWAQPVIEIYCTKAADFDALPGHTFDHDELDFMTAFAGCPTVAGNCGFAQDCGTTETYYVWGRFASGAINATIRGLHIVAGVSGEAVIDDSVIYRHRYDDGSGVWDRWDSGGPLVMHGDPGTVGRALAGTGNGIRNSTAPNPYDLYCNDTRIFLIGAIQVSCPIPCAGSGLQLGIGASGFQVFSATGQDLSAMVQLRLCGQPPISNPPPGGTAFWYQASGCTGIVWDCNHNDIPDECDISCYMPGCEAIPNCGQSADCDGNGQPDECQPGIGPPTILQQPLNQAICIGQVAALTVQAQGIPTPKYQWRKNGQIIAGATQATYTIPWFDPLDAGVYDVELTGCGSVVSEPATLTVIDKPVVTAPPAEQSVVAGTDVSFSVSVSGGGTFTYRWRRAGIELLNGPFVDGTRSDTLTILRPDTTDAGWYDVVITNECGYAVSPHALLTVNPGSCPPRGAPYVTKTYLLDGDAHGTPWSWRIESVDGKFTDAVDSHVEGVSEGGALAVAQRFAESVNAYAITHGRGADQLYAVGREDFGRTLLAIRTGGAADFRLWVGPADQAPSCLVVPEQLPACGFNPTITALPEEPAAARPAAAATPMTSGLLRGTRLESVASPTALRAPSGQTARSVPPSVALVAVAGDRPGGSRANRPTGTEATQFRGGNLILDPVTDLEEPPYSAVCKIYYRLLGEEAEATGFFVDPMHVLTSGLVVNEGGIWHSPGQVGRSGVEGEWATRADVVPRHWDGGGRWGTYNAESLWSFTEWVEEADTGDMFGIIELGHPIGAATGWLALAYPFPGIDATLVGYPSEWPYPGNTLCEAEVYVHGIAWPQFDYGSYYGMRGAPLCWWGNDVSWVHAWDDILSPTRAIALHDRHIDAIEDYLASERPNSPDLIPCALEVDRHVVEAGEFIYPQFRVVNYSDASLYAASFDAQVCLAWSNSFDPTRILGSGYATKQSFSPLASYVYTFSAPGVLIPDDWPAGTFWLGVHLSYADADPNNNATDFEAMVEIQVTCGVESAAPANLRATDGVFASKIRVEWDTVPGSTVVYDLYRDDDPEPPSYPYQTDLTESAFDDYDVTSGPTYYYWVQARNACGYTSPMTEYETGWAAFTSAPVVEASDGSDPTTVIITWNAVEGADSYRVWRNDVCDPNDQSLSVYTGSATTCEDPWSPTTGRRYYYFAQALSGANESGISACDMGWRGVPAPEGISATDGDDELYPDRVHVSWELVPGISHYAVWRAELLDPNTLQAVSPWVPASSSYDADFDDIHAVPGVDYKYYVRGSFYADGSCAGPLSEPDGGWRWLRPPTNVTASDGLYTDEVVITWNAPANRVRFTILRGTSDDPNDARTLENLPRPSPWIVETGWTDTTAVPGTVYYYWVQACGGQWCSHMTGVSTADTGWRALDCNSNQIPDPNDPEAIPPAITQQPVAEVVCLGAASEFSLAAESTLELAYQWRHNGIPLPGATVSTYSVLWTDPSDAGTYDAVVSTPCGSTASNPVTLTVLEPARIVQQPLDQLASEGDTVVLALTAAGDPPLSYLWRHGTVSLVDGGNVSGATTDTLTITNVQFADAGAYDVVVSNACGEVISLAGVLLVMGPACPAAGQGFVVHTYALAGAGSGTSWSWRIESGDGAFQNTPSVDVPGIVGTALDVAAAFADSINDYALVQGCPADGLCARAEELAGTVALAIRNGADAPLRLYVGAAGEPAEALVELPLAPCEFNPLIEQLPLPGHDCDGNRRDDLLDLVSGESTDVNHNGLPDNCESVGDVNCDGTVNVADINPFVLALSDLVAFAQHYPDCPLTNCDMNGDGSVNFRDINPFVTLLGGR